MAMAGFRNRVEAGRLLSDQVTTLGLVKPIVFAIPKGGIPVAREIANRLSATLDVVPEPQHENLEAREFSGVTADHTSKRKPAHDLDESDLVIVDDLIANGAAAIAAIQEFRKHGAARIIVAAPVVSTEAMERLLSIDNIEVCAVHLVQEAPALTELFEDDELSLSDDEVRSVSDEARRQQTNFGDAEIEWVDIQIGQGLQTARWRAPEKIRGVTVIVNTDGDINDASPAVEAVAEKLDAEGVATLSLNLTEFTADVSVLSQRVRQVSNWLSEYPPAEGLPLAYVGMGLGGAAMLEAAVGSPERVKALVCYEAPLQMIQDFVPRVHAPTLLVVRDEASENLEGNRRAFERIMVEKNLVVMANSTLRKQGVAAAIAPWISRFFCATSLVKKTRPSKGAPVVENQLQ